MMLTNGTDTQALRSQEERGEPTKSCQCTPGNWDAGEHEVNEEQSKDREITASNRAERGSQLFTPHSRKSRAVQSGSTGRGCEAGEDNCANENGL